MVLAGVRRDGSPKQKRYAGDLYRDMANTLLPPEERNLTPDEVVQLDRRRRRGQTCLTLSWQCLIIALLVLCWAGQDWTLSPGWDKPMVYWDAILFLGWIVFGALGVRYRRGITEFFSY